MDENLGNKIIRAENENFSIKVGSKNSNDAARIFLLKYIRLSLDMPIVRLLLKSDFFLFKKISIDNPFLTKDFAKLNPVNPPPKIQSFILIFNFNNKN